ncbi:MAG TPA: hypothetical protein VNZ61_16620 [Roseomonas sp.]|nr:hypothetical protein [Roseomonas sp.]
MSYPIAIGSDDLRDARAAGVTYAQEMLAELGASASRNALLATCHQVQQAAADAGYSLRDVLLLSDAFYEGAREEKARLVAAGCQPGRAGRA